MSRSRGKPHKLKVYGERYVAVVLHVEEFDADGRPRKARLLYPEESMKIEGGEVFEIVYMREEATKVKLTN